MSRDIGGKGERTLETKRGMRNKRFKLWEA